MALGAGSVADVARIRRMLEELKKWDQVMQDIPDMYEVEVKEKGQPASLVTDLSTFIVSVEYSSPIARIES